MEVDQNDANEGLIISGTNNEQLKQLTKTLESVNKSSSQNLRESLNKG